VRKGTPQFCIVRNFSLSSLLYTAGCNHRLGAIAQRGGNVSDVPLVLVVEDEYPLQGLVEEALREGGFETAILSSGEEALTLFRGKVAPIARSSPT
jgi:hypothetical protein